MLAKGEGLRAAFLCVKAHRNPLHGSYVIHRTSLLKIRQRNVPVFLIHAHRSDGSGNLLDQSQPLFPVLLVCPVYEFFQGGTRSPLLLQVAMIFFSYFKSLMVGK